MNVKIMLAMSFVVAACGSATDGQPSSTSPVGAPTSVPPATSVASTTVPATTVPPTTAAPTTAAPTTAAPDTTAATTTTTPLPRSADGFLIGTPFPVLVVGPSDVTYLEPDGSSVVVLDGGVYRAFDDGRGGVVFDVAPYDGPEPIWWVPAGATSARDVLVPSEGHWIELWGVDEADGAVKYVRWEGEGQATIATLRSFGLEDRMVEEYDVVGGWESGPLAVSYADGVAVVQVTGEGAVEARVIAVEGPGFDIEPVLPFYFDERLWDFPAYDGERLAFLEWQGVQGDSFALDIVVVDVATLDEIDRFELLRPDQGWLPSGLAYVHPLVIVNRVQPPDYDTGVLALVVDLESREVWEVPIPGWVDAVSDSGVDVAAVPLP